MATSKNHPTMIRHLLTTVYLTLGLTLAIGCNSQSGSATASDQTYREYTLTLHGYNYTDLEISSYEVNGQGGGNVEVSEGTEGGSGSVCCVSVYTPMTQPQPITIKWNPTGDKWCEQTVMLKPPLPDKPENFEVHFYQDGHIEVAVTTPPPTRISSPARIVLPRKHGNSRHQDARQNVDNSSKFARCQNGYF